MQGLKGKLYTSIDFDDLLFRIQQMIAENLKNESEAKRLRLLRNQLISLKSDFPHLFV